MRKVFLIISREYLNRVQKKSFLVLTFLLPTLIIGMYASIFLIFKTGDSQLKQIEIIDRSGIFKNEFKNQQNLEFKIINNSLASAKQKLIEQKETFLLFIDSNYAKSGKVEVLSQNKPSLNLVMDIESQMENILQNRRLLAAGIDTSVLNKVKAQVNINAKQISDEGEKNTSIGATAVIGFTSSFLIYMALFIYGAQVMRGVIEEKTNRIVEVIVSSVKPFQLMLGKILGIGAVGLTQFLLWIVLSTSLMSAASYVLVNDGENIKDKIIQKTNQNNGYKQANETSPNQITDMLNATDTIDFGYIITCFLFYFIGGYLIYSALFAAVGSAVDNETETQQFMLPITLPLIFTFIIGVNLIVNNPNSALAFWLSIIPFTSPVAMMIRIPFGVPAWQLALSVTLLIVGFLFTTWVASRIYRVGILMYGKKTSYKELVKWFFYKE
ncbi:MAG: ABC transporter permease [Sphingobacteriales bacterium]|nr:MAG: ABC transporter permease [Sphingobacteriales bacterium]TAF78236.1 MAG: ABC transporter permease [Sphingobacteriales bacterium]